MIKKLKAVYVVLSVLFVSGVFTGAYFSDTVGVSGNNFTAGVWSVTPTATVTVTPPVAGGLLVSEVYYDPDTAHGGGDAEWVELYNSSGSSIDLDGWSLWDNSSSEVISGTNVLPAGGYVVIAADASTFSHWSIPTALKIAVGGTKMFNGLNNSGDRVVLFTPGSVEMDAISWGTDSYAFSPSCPDVDSGHSLFRSPVTTDTGTNSDFIDETNPNPGV